MKYFVLLFSGFVLVCAVLSAEHHNEHHHQHLQEKSHEHHHQHLKEKSHEHHGKIHNSGRHHKTNERHRHHEAEHRVHPIHHEAHHRVHSIHHSYRANEKNQQCSWVCTDVSNSSSNSAIELALQVIYNSSSSLFAIESKSSNLALVLNYTSNIILTINGQSGVKIIVDLSSEQVTRIQESPPKGNLEEYLQKLSVSELIKTGQQFGQTSQLSSLPEVLSTEIAENLKHLGIPLPPTEALQHLKIFSTYLKDVLSLVYKGTGSFPIKNNISWFLKLNILFGNLLSPENSGIDLSKINIDPKTVFQGTSGIEALVKLFSQIGENTNLSKLAGNLFSSREKGLKLLSDVSSGSNNGLDGLITILVNVAKAFNGQGSSSDVISSVLKYNDTGLDEPTYAQIINQALALIESQNNLFHNGASFTEATKFLKALVDNNLFLNNVNISDIIKIFLSPNPMDKLSTVIKIMSTFSPISGIQQFYKFIADLSNSTEGVKLFSNLIPGLNVSQYTNILQGRNLTQLLSSGGNISSIFSQVPIFGNFISKISQILQEGGHNLQHYFNPELLQSLGNVTSTGNIFGGIPSLIEHGIQQAVNSTSGGNPLGGLPSAIEQGIHQAINLTQGSNPLGSIASSLQNGVQQAINSSQGGNPLGAIASGIQNQAENSTQGGSFFGNIASGVHDGISKLASGIGNNFEGHGQVSTAKNSSEASSSAPEPPSTVSDSTNTTELNVQTGLSDSTPPDATDSTHSNSSGGQSSGWGLTGLGLRGVLSGSVSAGLSIANRNKGVKADHHLHKLKSEEKHKVEHGLKKD